jgi:hypothetical protein
LNCPKNKWLEEVKVIFFGLSEKLAAFDTQVQEKLKELKGYIVEVLALLLRARNILKSL